MYKVVFANLKDLALVVFANLKDLALVQVNFSDAFEALSFKWNRCWNNMGFGERVVFYPTHEMIDSIHWTYCRII